MILCPYFDERESTFLQNVAAQIVQETFAGFTHVNFQGLLFFVYSPFQAGSRDQTELHWRERKSVHVVPGKPILCLFYFSLWMYREIRTFLNGAHTFATGFHA